MQLEDESAKLATTLNAQQVAYFRALVSDAVSPPYECTCKQPHAVRLGRADVQIDTSDAGDRV
jgi:hypothetical protein